MVKTPNKAKNIVSERHDSLFFFQILEKGFFYSVLGLLKNTTMNPLLSKDIFLCESEILNELCIGNN